MPRVNPIIYQTDPVSKNASQAGKVQKQPQLKNQRINKSSLF